MLITLNGLERQQEISFCYNTVLDNFRFVREENNVSYLLFLMRRILKIICQQFYICSNANLFYNVLFETQNLTYVWSKFKNYIISLLLII